MPQNGEDLIACPWGGQTNIECSRSKERAKIGSDIPHASDPAHDSV